MIKRLDIARSEMVHLAESGELIFGGSMGWAKRYHSTFSVSGGVVSEPR